MSNAIVKSLIQNLAIFHGVNEDEARIIAFIGNRIRYNINDLIYQAGDISDKALLVVNGRVKIEYPDIDQPNVVVKRGAILQELSLFNDRKDKFNLIALDQVSATEIRQEEFMRLLEEFPEIGHKIQHNIANRLNNLSQAF